jgi:predicted RecA/RadA family phage recombinase
MKNFIQSGTRMSWTNGGTAVVSGQVVKVGNILAVACTDIANGASGELAFGVYTVPKVTGAVVAQGESLTWDVSAAKFDDNAATPASGDVTGAAAVAWAAGANGETTLAVCFTGVPGSVT